MINNLEIKLSFLWETINSFPGLNVAYAIEKIPEWSISFDVADEEEGLISITMLAADLMDGESLDIKFLSPEDGFRFTIKSSEDPCAVADWLNQKRNYF